MTKKNPQRSENSIPPLPADASPLQHATRTFEDAVAKQDYAAAILAAFPADAFISVDDDTMSRAILDKYFPTKAAAAQRLRDKVFWGTPIPPVLALHVADLLEGKNLGRPRRSRTKTIVYQVELMSLIGALGEPAISAGASKTAALEIACKRAQELFRQVRCGSMPSDAFSKEVVDLLSKFASEPIGHADWESIRRAYRRARQNLSKKGQEKS